MLEPESNGQSVPHPARPRTRIALKVVAMALPVLFASLVLALLWRLDTSFPGNINPADFSARGSTENRPAPSFSLSALAGVGSIRLEDFPGTPLVLNLWASWCDPCREEAPVLEGLWRRYSVRGVRFLGVDHLDSKGAALAFLGDFGITYPSAFDPNGTVSSRYGAIGIPTTFVIDGQGRIVYRFLGRVRGPDLADVLDRLLEGKH